MDMKVSRAGAGEQAEGHMKFTDKMHLHYVSV